MIRVTWINLPLPKPCPRGPQGTGEFFLVDNTVEVTRPDKVCRRGTVNYRHALNGLRRERFDLAQLDGTSDEILAIKIFLLCDMVPGIMRRRILSRG